ncbi:MAG: hypothetical protein IIW14_04160 [Kiritimatiellae bacterium]|nr:hypothetical protein [Kiritimatiellia bacterium]
MKKTKSNKATVVVSGLPPITQSSNPPIHQPSDAATAAQLMEQYRVVVAAERASFRERVKFGAMLILWEQYLGESRGGMGGTSSEGLKGWLEQNCPAISYTAAMNYKYAAERAVSMLGGGAMATAALLGESEVTQPSGETVEVSAQIIEKRDAIFEDATSRRKLEQMYFDFMKKNGERGTGNGERNMLPKISKQEAARAIWARLMSELDKRTVKDAIALLPPKDAEVCHGRLFELTKLLKEQMSVSC